MPHCPQCKNLNVVVKEDYTWCRSCNWTSDGKEPPRLAGK